MTLILAIAANIEAAAHGAACVAMCDCVIENGSN